MYLCTCRVGKYGSCHSCGLMSDCLQHQNKVIEQRQSWTWLLLMNRLSSLLSADFILLHSWFFFFLKGEGGILEEDLRQVHVFCLEHRCRYLLWPWGWNQFELGAWTQTWQWVTWNLKKNNDSFRMLSKSIRSKWHKTKMWQKKMNIWNSLRGLFFYCL